MKKALVLTMAVALIILSGTITFADDGIIFKHGVINEDDEYSTINIATPYFDGFNGSDAVNHFIRDIVIDYIGTTRATGKELKEFERKTDLTIYYDYSKYDNLLSVRLNTYIYLGGAHGGSQIHPITINSSTGNIYSFKNLFKDEAKAIEFAENYILASIKENPEAYFENYEESIKSKEGNFDFYLDGDKLVVYFGEYEIAPYASGIRYFEFNAKDIKDILKDEIYNSIMDSNNKGLITYNGADINSKNKIIITEDWTIMVPLRDIAEALGYEIGWDKENGAIIAGNSIKSSIDAYNKSGDEELKINPPEVIDSSTYVPIEYFKEVLNENVIFTTDWDDEPAIKVYGKEGHDNNFDKLIKGFCLPLSADEAINMYAEAIKNRNGVVQYGLLTGKLKKEKYFDFADAYFVTGVSSPWVDSYEIRNTGVDTYAIDFVYKTSVPDESFLETLNLTVENTDEFWRIHSIE